MKVLNNVCLAFCLGTVLVALSPRARADQWNKKTVITVNQPLDISGTVLQPGKYVLQLADSVADRHIVRVLNADGTKVEATILAIPYMRTTPASTSRFAYWEMPAGQPLALKSWLYPGDLFGQEFERPPEVAVATPVAQAAPTQPEPQTQPTLVAEAAPPQEPAPAAAPEPAPAPAPAEVAKAEPEQQPAPAPETSAMPEPQPAPASTPLPKTASPYPLVGLAGLLSLGAAVGTRVLKRIA